MDLSRSIDPKIGTKLLYGFGLHDKLTESVPPILCLLSLLIPQ